MTTDNLAINGNDTTNVHSGDIDTGRAFYLDPAAVDPAHPGAIHNGELYVRRGAEGVVRGEPSPGADDETLAAESPAVMVAEVEKQIARLERDLAEVAGYDPATGQPIGKLTGRARANAERTLAVMQHTTLPYTRIRAAEIEAAKATLPTQADKLAAEGARMERIKARALELAEEAEAEAMAERLRAAKRPQSVG